MVHREAPVAGVVQPGMHFATSCVRLDVLG
jgi:hypothetical protein